MEMKEKEVKDFVKKRYGEMAKAEKACCESCGSCSTARSNKTPRNRD